MTEIVLLLKSLVTAVLTIPFDPKLIWTSEYELLGL